MIKDKQSRLAIYGAFVLSAALWAQPAQAANFTLSGTIQTDDALQLFSFTVGSTGTVDLRSYGYAGGATSTGSVAPSGGFDPILTLFSASGTFLMENDDGAGVAIDPATGQAYDARITGSLNPGSYILAITQYDNFARGTTLADGFTETGNPNFTASVDFASGGSCPGNLFRDTSGTPGLCRNGNWTVDFVNVASATPLAAAPEPSAFLLAGAGLGSLLLAGWSKRCRTVRL